MASLNPESAEALAALLQSYAVKVPPDANPYMVLRQELANLISYKPPKSANPLLIVGSVLLAIVSTIFIAGFIVRARRGTLWSWRIVRVGREKYLLGSLVFNKAGFDAITSITLQVFVWLVYRANQGEIVQHRILALILPWLPGGIAACLAAWTLTTTYILHLRTYASESARVPWYSSALAVNSVGIAVPVILLGSTLPLTILASTNYDEGMSNYFQFDSILAQAQRSWKKRDDLDSKVLDDASSALFLALVDFRDAAKWFKRTYWCLTAWCSAFTVVFFLVGALYSRALSKVIAELKSVEGVGFKAFTKTRRWLLHISSMFVITMAAVAIHSAWISVYSDSMFTNGLLSELAVILPVFTIAILGLPVSILLLLHAWQTPTSASSVGITSTSGRSPVSTLNFPRSPSSTDLSRHYTQVQFSLAAQLPLPDRPFFGMLTKATKMETSSPFADLELTSRDSTLTGKVGIVIERNEEVTVVTLPKETDRDFGEEVEEIEKW
ncbi:uncharacterized protein JCM6883_005976 [Sporobolomyces salmoneus]|uniref:uncharacterized protein n=1 Tax=Sporobolomyces salmoneus TaxID=183962 RepID=UPI0031726FB5